MSPKTDTQKSAKSTVQGFTDEERAAMKERVQERKAEAHRCGYSPLPMRTGDRLRARTSRPLVLSPSRAASPTLRNTMEAVLRPGMKSLVHRHSGPEAWYTLAGETCLE